jgi:hypothetical protein
MRWIPLIPFKMHFSLRIASCRFSIDYVANLAVSASTHSPFLSDETEADLPVNKSRQLFWRHFSDTECNLLVICR